jgi:hypothetical protein
VNVLIIPEDFRKDEQVLKPIITALMTAVEKPRARVLVCRDPLLGGISQALRQERIEEILDRYRGMVDLFLLLVDRDGEAGRRERLNQLEQTAAALLPPDRHFLAENAWQELEVWLLAGHELLPGWNWQEIRTERDPKEAYFVPLAESRGLLDEPDQGRGRLAKEAARNYSRIRTRCPEVADLEAAVRGKVG